MWNKPQLMTAVADLLSVAAAAALLVAALVLSARLPMFPLRELVVSHSLREVRRAEVETALSGLLHGNFFSVNLDLVRQSLEQLPWVRHAEVRRQWPARIEVDIEEHVPVAFWGQATGQLVNTNGEVFAAAMSVPPSESTPVPMPVLMGPVGMAPEMLGYYQQAVDMLKPIGRMPNSLTISPRLAVQLQLDDGMTVELGRVQSKAPARDRLQRFVEYYPSVISAAKTRPSVVDMRYPNGFALRVATAPVIESKGKP